MRVQHMNTLPGQERTRHEPGEPDLARAQVWDTLFTVMSVDALLRLGGFAAKAAVLLAHPAVPEESFRRRSQARSLPCQRWLPSFICHCDLSLWRAAAAYHVHADPQDHGAPCPAVLPVCTRPLALMVHSTLLCHWCEVRARSSLADR